MTCCLSWKTKGKSCMMFSFPCNKTERSPRAGKQQEGQKASLNHHESSYTSLKPHESCEVLLGFHIKVVFLSQITAFSFSNAKKWTLLMCLIITSFAVLQIFSEPWLGVIFEPQQLTIYFYSIENRKTESQFALTRGWINDDGLFISGWTVSLKTHLYHTI